MATIKNVFKSSAHFLKKAAINLIAAFFVFVCIQIVCELTVFGILLGWEDVNLRLIKKQGKT